MRSSKNESRHLPNQVSILGAMLILLILALMCAPATAKNKVQKNPQDPYVTAEYEIAPAVDVAALEYRSILFENCTVPPEWEAKARKLVTATQDKAIIRLSSTRAFSTIARKQSPLPEDPYIVVKWTLLNYRMVGGKTRFFAGAAAGTSYITYRVRVHDGKSDTLLFQREISTENNPIAAAWSFNDKNLPTFLGNVLADYLALRARKDKGVAVLPLENVAQTAAGTPN